MKAVIQRVLNASVEVENNTVSKIENGFLILLGVEHNDTESSAQVLASKVAKLRVFSDENDKMNLSLIDTGYEALVVSQFTLCADCKKGNRPSFSSAAQPKIANELYEFFINELIKCGVADVKKGVFGADMKISLVNDGPVTIIYDTKEWEK
ncbi:MAG: D-aminoacyl-tRNA deacylase [Acutalibacteraceae bacterium]|jgi:D-tyrosyl-tRNA(Tyr) deacylase|nr:D-tyrosyl-tRNA(Tyr) deacylase [Clostridiales bacterium]